MGTIPLNKNYKGFPSAFGVILDAYLKDPILASQKDAFVLLPLIGTFSNGLMFCLCMYSSPKLPRFIFM
jgi:hypothetical protein